MGGFLRNVVTDAIEDFMCVPAGELAAVAGAVHSRAIEIARDRDGRNGNDRPRREALFHLIVLRFALSQAEPDIMRRGMSMSGNVGVFASPFVLLTGKKRSLPSGG